MISEYLGRERAAVSGLVAANRPMSTQDINALALFRGRVEAAWDYVQAYAEKSSVSPELAAAHQGAAGERVHSLRRDAQIGLCGRHGRQAVSDVVVGLVRAIDRGDRRGAGAERNGAGREAASLARLAESRSTRLLFFNAVLMAASLALALLTLWIVLWRVTGSLRQMTHAMARLAGGELATDIPCRDRRDELGSMARAMACSRTTPRRSAMQSEREAMEQAAREEKAAAMNGLANELEASVASVVQTVQSASADLNVSAATMSKAASQTAQQSGAVATTTAQASINIQTVASAAEQLSASINEIARQIADTTRVASDAVEQTNQTNELVEGLAQAADRIGEVVKLIDAVASQTNLLALNATIEAARAGEAGRGFAVVASEVKALASQTSHATGEIASQVGAIQQSTGDAVDAIRRIAATIEKLNGTTNAIAAAIEEQSSATQEIARNVQQVAQGTNEISVNISRRDRFCERDRHRRDVRPQGGRRTIRRRRRRCSSTWSESSGASAPTSRRAVSPSSGSVFALHANAEKSGRARAGSPQCRASP